MSPGPGISHGQAQHCILPCKRHQAGSAMVYYITMDRSQNLLFSRRRNLLFTWGISAVDSPRRSSFLYLRSYYLLSCHQWGIWKTQLLTTWLPGLLCCVLPQTLFRIILICSKAHPVEVYLLFEVTYTATEIVKWGLLWTPGSPSLLRQLITEGFNDLNSNYTFELYLHFK